MHSTSGVSIAIESEDMKTGDYQGIGVEKEGLRDWRFILGILGFVQLFVYLPLGAYAADFPKAITISEYWSGLEISLGVAVMAVFAFLVLRMSQGGLGIYALEWSESSSRVGEIVMNYVTPNGKKRSGLIVRRVEPRPEEPLYVSGRSRYQPLTAVKGAEASIMIDFSNESRFSLQLGFSNPDDMYRFYSQLKPGSPLNQ
jgi:hypothetical protein